MHRSRIFLPLVCAIIVLLFCAPVSKVGAQVESSKASPGATKPATPRDPTLIDLDGYKRVLAKFRGKPLLVTFWATWCEPCREEFPMVVELSKQYAPQGLAVFGVSLDDDSAMHLVRHFLALHQPNFPNYRQKPGIDVDAFYQGVNPAWTGTMPETVFYGRDGQIAGHFVGEQPRATFEQGIQTILASPPASPAK